MALRSVEFLAIVFTALALVPAGAHLFELPNKIALDQEQYFIVQTIYRGWSLFAVPLFGAMLSILALAVMLRGYSAPFWLATAAFAGVVASLAIFFIWTYPANVATSNWTVIPENWEALRAQWEYSHAANALVMFAAFCLVTLATTARR